MIGESQTVPSSMALRRTNCDRVNENRPHRGFENGRNYFRQSPRASNRGLSRAAHGRQNISAGFVRKTPPCDADEPVALWRAANRRGAASAFIGTAAIRGADSGCGADRKRAGKDRRRGGAVSQLDDTSWFNRSGTEARNR